MVRIFWLSDAMPTPILELNNNKKSVEVTLKVKHITARQVWLFLRKRSFFEKEVAYITIHTLILLDRVCYCFQHRKFESPTALFFHHESQQ